MRVAGASSNDQQAKPGLQASLGHWAMGSVMDRCWFSSLVREKMGILRDSMEKLPATWAWIPARICSDVNTVVGAESTARSPSEGPMCSRTQPRSQGGGIMHRRWQGLLEAPGAKALSSAHGSHTGKWTQYSALPPPGPCRAAGSPYHSPKPSLCRGQLPSKSPIQEFPYGDSLWQPS